MTHSTLVFEDETESLRWVKHPAWMQDKCSCNTAAGSQNGLHLRHALLHCKS